MYLERILNHRRGGHRYGDSAAQLRHWRERAADGPAPRDFAAALAQGTFPTIIAEIKRASPSKGPLRPELDPAQLARAYEAGGAAALSVLTEEEYFRGSLDDLVAARRACGLPVLRKDFLLEPWEVYEARAHGADAVLLIAAALETPRLAEMQALAHELGMAALVEVHDEKELHDVLTVEPRIVGINNRNLKTFEVDLQTTTRLVAAFPKGVLSVSESGFAQAADLAGFENLVDAFLIGESLVTSQDSESALRRLKDC